ncbi:MAG: thiamine-binding protein [Fulvivirga sp.]|nr:thiamine-binding protein [Fulvivirga sp.]
MKYNIHAGIQIIPRSDNDDIYPIIDKAIAIIQQSGLKNQVTPMETVIEGPYEKVMEVIYRAQQEALKAGANELLVNIKLHIRKGSDITFQEKTGKY